MVWRDNNDDFGRGRGTYLSIGSYHISIPILPRAPSRFFVTATWRRQFRWWSLVCLSSTWTRTAPIWRVFFKFDGFACWWLKQLVLLRSFIESCNLQRSFTWRLAMVGKTRTISSSRLVGLSVTENVKKKYIHKYFQRQFDVLCNWDKFWKCMINWSSRKFEFYCALLRELS